MDQQQQLRHMSTWFGNKMENPGDDEQCMVQSFEIVYAYATARYLDKSGKHADNDLLFNADERSKAAAGVNDDFPTLARLAEYVTVEELETVAANANNL